MVSDKIQQGQHNTKVGQKPQVKVVQVDVVWIYVHLCHIERLDLEEKNQMENGEENEGDNNEIICHRFHVRTANVGKWLNIFPLEQQDFAVDKDVNKSDHNASSHH